jgi:hypothetical protein
MDAKTQADLFVAVAPLGPVVLGPAFLVGEEVVVHVPLAETAFEPFAAVHS